MPSPNPKARTNGASGPLPDTGNLFINSLGVINRCYKGTSESEKYENSYSHRFALWWNSMFVADDDDARRRRDALAGVAAAIYVAFLGLTASVLKDWFLE
jgi:hypothetical protein